MKAKAAVVFEQGGKFETRDVEIADPIGAEVLVETRGSGLCASDIHIIEDEYGMYPFPFVAGHELAGVVIGLGPDVTNFEIGDKVVGSLIQFCGHCDACLDGRTYQCQNPAETLRGPDDPARITLDGEPITQAFGLGAFASHALVHQNQLVKIDADIPAAQAAILGCGVITGAGAAINTAGVKPGDSVAVFGAGGVGLNALQGAKVAGATKIIAVDLSDEKLELTKKFGATHTINSGNEDPVAAIQEITGGGANHTFEVIGLDVTEKQAIAATGVGGGAYFIGLRPPSESISIEVLTALLIGQTRVQGVYMGSTNIRHDIPMYAELYQHGNFNLDDLVSKEISLDEINEGYEAQKRGGIARSVITKF